MSQIFTQNGDLLMLLQGTVHTMETVHLYKNPITPDPTTVLADLEEADFSGYIGGLTLSWGAGFINAIGKGQRLAASVQWQSVGPMLVTNMIYGVYVLSDTNLVVSVEPFAAPINVNADAINILYQPSITCVTEPPGP